MKVLLAGGGTAGHIEPAIAVGRALRKRDADCELLFLGTASGLENTLIPAAGFTLHLIPKVRIARRIHPSLLKVPFQLIASVASSARALKGVDLLIGFGGYVSAPAYLAAKLLRVPILIHEQNAHPGWANRIGARFTDYVALSYPVKKGSLHKGVLTGLPLRSDVIEACHSAKSDWKSARESAKRDIADHYGVDSKDPLIFIFGGSQGSQAINSVIEAARATLERDGYAVIHGVGKNNLLPESTPHYRALSYIDEMAKLYLAADLIISRSGAVTCAEIAALGKYALFIPLPVGNGEQAHNAAPLVDAGRAKIVDQSIFTSEWLIAHVAELIAASRDRDLAGSLDSIDAADKIAEMALHAAKEIGR
jgi:UDP-N-acetylglucosamine--N-acetylmuramyl-(pentapeptide) pyrophosphoryl-undecaprenol N-acetylglucosamine transferase